MTVLILSCALAGGDAWRMPFGNAAFPIGPPHPQQCPQESNSLYALSQSRPRAFQPSCIALAGGKECTHLNAHPLRAAELRTNKRTGRNINDDLNACCCTEIRSLALIHPPLEDVLCPAGQLSNTVAEMT
jgi:hypothetical protein